MTALMTAFFAEIALITYRGTFRPTPKKTPLKGLPVPADYVGAMIIFTVLGALPGQAARPAAIFGWGLVTATFLNLYNPNQLPKTGTKPLAFPTVPGKPNYFQVPITAP